MRILSNKNVNPLERTRDKFGQGLVLSGSGVCRQLLHKHWYDRRTLERDLAGPTGSGVAGRARWEPAWRVMRSRVRAPALLEGIDRWCAWPVAIAPAVPTAARDEANAGSKSKQRSDGLCSLCLSSGGRQVAQRRSVLNELRVSVTRSKVEGDILSLIHI